MIISRDEYGDGSLFRSQCEMLQNNDPTVTFVDASYGHDGYGLLLGRGLLTNTIVENIELNVSSFFSQDEGHPNDNRREEAVPMQSYIRSSPTLKKVTLMRSWNPVEFNLTGQLLMAIAESVHVTSLVAHVRLPVTEFVHLLTCSRGDANLRYMRVGPDVLRGYRDNATLAASVANAFGANETLDFLHLDFAAETDEVAGQILSQLGSNSKLSHLIVEDEGRQHYENTAVLSGLGSFLSASNALTVLEIHWINFDLAKMDLLCDGLQRNRTCGKLVMESCTLTEEATQRWIDYVQSDANREGNVLRDVKMTVRDMEQFSDRTFENARSTSVIPAMLHGSALQKFALSALLFDTATLLNELIEHMAAIAVPCLLLEGTSTDMASMQALARYLVVTATLRSLQMRANRDCATMLLAALRQNGSLTQVSLVDHENVSIFNAQQQARVDAYCTRNAMVGPMLSKAGCTTTFAAAADENDINDNVSNESRSLEQVPALFAAALPAPRTNANTILIGLMATTTAD